MNSPPSVIDPDRPGSIGNRASDGLAEQTKWIQPLNFSETDEVDPSRLWRGIFVALPFAAAFWALVWLAVSRMLRI
jgi:hypothetical protein